MFPALAKSRIDQVSLECFHSHVPPDLMALLAGKEVMVGVIDVASDEIETPQQVADTIGAALRFVPAGKLIACTNCGLAPMSREVAEAKLAALVAGARLATERLARVAALGCDMAVQWQRLWQPRNPMFWMMVGFNALSSVCGWALRALPLNMAGLLVVGLVALLNVGAGLLAAWVLLRTEPPAR